MFPPYFCFRFRLYGPPDGHFCLIFARMGWQTALGGTNWERGVSCTTLITPSVEDFTEQYITSPFHCFCNIGPIGWEVFKLEYLKNLSSDFRKIFWDCSPRPAASDDAFTYPVPQLGEGPWAPKVGGDPPKISHFRFPWVQISTTISSGRECLHELEV